MLNVNEVKEKILTLRSGNALLAIIPEVGGCITRYCLKTEEQDLELMRPSTQVGLAAEDPTEMSYFPLIPFSNRIRNGRFSFQGKKIKMLTNFPPEVHTIHGHGWKAPWTVSEVKENRAVLAYQHFPNEWPFSYLARQVFDLEESSLTVSTNQQYQKLCNASGYGTASIFCQDSSGFDNCKNRKNVDQ